MNTSHPVWRSLLYVPANNPRFIAKAHLRGADGIILDLEDSVPNSELEYARKELRSSAVSASQNGADVLIRSTTPMTWPSTISTPRCSTASPRSLLPKPAMRIMSAPSPRVLRSGRRMRA